MRYGQMVVQTERYNYGNFDTIQAHYSKDYQNIQNLERFKKNLTAHESRYIILGFLNFPNLDTGRGFGQEESLPCSDFNYILVSRHKFLVLFSTSAQLVTNDTGVISCIKRNVTAAFSAIERESVNMTQAVNYDKTKYILSTYMHMPSTKFKIINVNFLTYEVINEFICIGFTVTSENTVVPKRRSSLYNETGY